MSVDGRVSIDLVCDGGRVMEAIVTPPRPVALGPIVRARPVTEVISAIGSLFSVCSIAQSAASVEAAEAALEIGTDRRTKQARRLLVLTETLREHLLRIGLDTASLAGEPADGKTLRRSMRLPQRLKQALFPGGNAFVPGVCVGIPGADAAETAAEASHLTQSVVYEGEKPLGEMDRDAFAQWAMERGTIAARLIAPVLARGWAMIGHPETTNGGNEHLPKETSADTSCLARQAGAPLVRAFLSENGGAGLAARLAARVVEASTLPAQIAGGLAALRDVAEGSEVPTREVFRDENGGRSATAFAEAARGRLEHRIVLNDDRIADYAITAPTSIHFAESGIAASSLSALAASRREDLAVQADLLVRAIDPCVGYDIRLR
ncbi:hypothetical protein NKJ73_32620 [Mesorhizobium sp. M0074]|uniref:hypothetical protein n=2 Tax=unclassified Mesorhizobium TaxID=325217 RepID=UPI0003CEAB57|nr:hypothetical protein [Mesorhizobium sp. LSJC280B00]ESW79700.1 hypothetical protein X772_26910 [Mesorhizobium sp. LSJC280B00]